MANFGTVFYQTFTNGFYFFHVFTFFNVFLKFLSERLRYLCHGQSRTLMQRESKAKGVGHKENVGYIAQSGVIFAASCKGAGLVKNSEQAEVRLLHVTFFYVV